MVTRASAGPSTAVPAGMATSVRGCSSSDPHPALVAQRLREGPGRSAVRCWTSDDTICGSTSLGCGPRRGPRLAS